MQRRIVGSTQKFFLTTRLADRAWPSLPCYSRRSRASPVPLRLFPGRVLDHRDRPVLGRPARLTRRPQPANSQLTGHRRIGAVIAELEQLVEQRGRPQVWIVPQALGAVRRERVEPVSPTGGPNPSLPPGQVGPDGLAVFTQMPGRSLRSSNPGDVTRARRCRPPV